MTMETQLVMELEGHPSVASLGAQRRNFTALEFENSSHSCSQLDLNEETNNGFVGNMCLQEPESVSSRETMLDTSLRATAHDGNSASCVPDVDGCESKEHSNSHPKDPSAEERCGHKLPDVKETGPVSNGHPAQNLKEPSQTVRGDTVTVLKSKSPDLPRIVKHKPSSITFSDYADVRPFINESSDDGESSREEEAEDHDDGDGDDDDDDDVFHELPLSRAVTVNHRPRSNGKERRNSRQEVAHSDSSGGYEAGSSSTEESPLVKSPWSDSMTQLMKKLDQLNLDIEEALSASSSPSDTPCTTRKKQWAAASKPNQALNDHALPRCERGDSLSPSRSPSNRAATLRTRTKKGMSNKTVHAGGAGNLNLNNKLDWTKITDALFKKGQSRLFLLRRLRVLLRIFEGDRSRLNLISQLFSVSESPVLPGSQPASNSCSFFPSVYLGP